MSDQENEEVEGGGSPQIVLDEVVNQCNKFKTRDVYFAQFVRQAPEDPPTATATAVDYNSTNEVVLHEGINFEDWL